jgi:peptide deformylase
LVEVETCLNAFKKYQRPINPQAPCRLEDFCFFLYNENMKDIIQKENLILRKNAKEVSANEITAAKIRKIINDMKKALSAEESGVAIAAPQIGVSLRIFIVAGKIFKDPEDENTPAPPDLVFINPVVVNSSKEKEVADEGCLSVKNWFGKVERQKKMTVKAFNEKGEQFRRGGSGLLSQIFQHEIDHLNGILFTDKAIEMREHKQHNDEKQN